MMMRDLESGSSKDISEYSLLADKVFAFEDDQLELNNFIDKLYFKNGKFVKE
jgi:hypothetical protein